MGFFFLSTPDGGLRRFGNWNCGVGFGGDGIVEWTFFFFFLIKLLAVGIISLHLALSLFLFNCIVG